MPHEVEDVLSTSQFTFYATRFIDYSVNKYTGLDLIKFMSLPRYEVEELLKLCQKSKKADNQMISELEAGFGLNK